jgi:hypothetical protein
MNEVRSRALAATGCLLAFPVCAQEDADALAKQLANPVSALISVPFQFNWDSGLGADDGSLLRLNIQPVLPFSLTEDWNLISRTIVPLIDQNDVPFDGVDDSGLGDIVQSFFFSPVKPVGGWILGVGPVLLLPTATNAALGADAWGIGPTGVALRQSGPWTYGALINHIESVGGSGRDVSATFLQPFLTHVSSRQTTISANFEATYDWQSESWSLPFNLNISQLVKLGNQRLQIGGGLRYWMDTPPGGPEGIGLRAQVTLLFPRG